MNREPKVACIELNCALRDEPKNNKKCEMCADRERFADAIEATMCLAPISIGYSLEADFEQHSVASLDGVLNTLNIFFFGAKA